MIRIIITEGGIVRVSVETEPKSSLIIPKQGEEDQDDEQVFVYFE